MKTLTWGNGIQLSRQYDQDYQLTQQNVGSWQTSYSFDANGNIKSRDHSLFGPANYNYDALDRLTQEQTTTRRKKYAYDAVGNRKSRYGYTTTDGVETQTSTQLLYYATDSNRMTLDANIPIVMDATGNSLQRSSSRVHVYDEQGRLSQVLNPTALYADFFYNALGQRTIKRTYLSSGALNYTITHLYGPDGQLLGQVRYNNLGKKTSAQYWIWLDGMPLAEIEFNYNTNGAVTSTGQYYLHSDHLNTPRLATNQAQTLLWSWDGDAFGLGNPVQDVDGDGVLLDIPLRFPGQIYEAYSNLNYNYFRDYDPDKGRYVQSDPIGLEGGLNTYGYVAGNPLKFSDTYGLFSIALPGWMLPYVLPKVPAIPATVSIPAAVGGIFLLYPNNSLAGPELSECPQGGCYYSESDSGGREKKKPKSGTSGKDGAKDVPSWAKGERPYKGESGKDFADRLLGGKYGAGNYPTGPGSEHSKIRKYGDRSFE